jgi:lysophospholipase L1-like esterase
LLLALLVGCGSSSTASPASTAAGSANTAGAPSAGAPGAGAPSTGEAGASGSSAGGPGGGASGGAVTDYGGAGNIVPGVPPDYNPCAAVTTCVILPLGDSITYGDQSSDQAGWRSRLFHLTLANNKSITFVGGQMSGPATVDGVPFPNHHEAHPGYEISGAHGIESFTAQAVSSFPAQMLLLTIGTNDMADVTDPPNAPMRLGGLIDVILMTDPKLLLVVAKIPPSQDDATNTLIDAYNAAMPDVVSSRARAGKHIALIDTWTPIASNPNYKTEYLANKLHPNDAGYTKMAEAWYALLGSLFPAKQ